MNRRQQSEGPDFYTAALPSQMPAHHRAAVDFEVEGGDLTEIRESAMRELHRLAGDRTVADVTFDVAAADIAVGGGGESRVMRWVGTVKALILFTAEEAREHSPGGMVLLAPPSDLDS